MTKCPRNKTALKSDKLYIYGNLVMYTYTVEHSDLVELTKDLDETLYLAICHKGCAYSFKNVLNNKNHTFYTHNIGMKMS